MRVLSVFMFLVLSTFMSCESGSGGSSATLPKARGANGEIIVVIDSAKKVGIVGEQLKEIFRGDMGGLPQPEPFFNARFIEPKSLNSVLKLVKNLVYVATLDDNSSGGQILLRNFTETSIERIKNDPELFMLVKSNQFARGQEVMHLFGRNDKELAENLMRNGQMIRSHFLNLEKERRVEELYRSQEKLGLQKSLIKNHEFQIRVPFGYDLAKQDTGFVWIRQYDRKIDKNIFIYYQDYRSSEIFDLENIIRLRNGIGQEFLRDIQEQHIYMTTEERFPPEIEEISFNGKYAVESRGLWKLSDFSRGGPFISYIFVDESLNRLYYIEGYVDAPGQDKRNPMMELETILSTFQTANELKTSPNS